MVRGSSAGVDTVILVRSQYQHRAEEFLGTQEGKQLESLRHTVFFNPYWIRDATTHMFLINGKKMQGRWVQKSEIFSLYTYHCHHLRVNHSEVKNSEQTETENMSLLFPLNVWLHHVQYSELNLKPLTWYVLLAI